MLVVRLGAMGDILHALPAVTALRKAHPTWKIDWAVEPRWLPLLSAEPENAHPDAARTEARPVVDQIHCVPTKAWGKQPLHGRTRAELGALRRALRAGKYDAVLDLQGAIRSAVVARMTACRRVIGESSPREGIARWLFTERVKTLGEHVIEQDIELASAVAGDLLSPMAPALPVDTAAEDWADKLEILKAAHWKGLPIVLVHPGAGWGAKRWPVERYGEVVEELAQRGAVVLVNAGPGEAALAESVVRAAHEEGTVVVSTLAQLIALTRRVSLVIGGDTGPLHLACALAKPVVGIYGPTDPRRNGPFGTRFRVLRNPESQQDHTRREEPEAGLLTITPEAVLGAAMELMLADRHARNARAETQELPGPGRPEGDRKGRRRTLEIQGTPDWGAR
jgi:heptosyltransferase-1